MLSSFAQTSMFDFGIFMLYIGVMTIICPECKNDKNIEIKDTEVGRWFECDYCGVSFEITKVKPDGSVDIKIIEEEK